MSLATRAYQRLPAVIQPVVKKSYYYIHPRRIPEAKVKQSRSKFIRAVFDSEKEYYRYMQELKNSEISQFLSEAQDRANSRRGTEDLGNPYYQDVYAYVRKTNPDIIVETGVRDGWSTLYILAALYMNDTGKLYSIDYPIRENEYDSQTEDTGSQNEGVPTIPSGTDPGWIVPEELKQQWELSIGKSQEKMPLLFNQIEEIDVFIHDSDHSLPCMMFEYELGWEWLVPSGIIFSDDISWNSAFDDFVESKGCEYGYLSNSFGYVIKQE